MVYEYDATELLFEFAFFKKTQGITSKWLCKKNIIKVASQVLQR